MTHDIKYQKINNYFKALIKHNTLSHAYLFSGHDSKGKKEFAGNICTLLTGKGFDNNPDLKLIYPGMDEEKYNIDIKNIRELKSFMYLKPHSSKYKLAVIEDADTISIGAANAMLKILEEPPKSSVLVLISSKPSLLPKTILSRCEAVVFSPVAEVKTAEMDKALAELRKVARQPLADRIQYAKKLCEKENYPELVNLWLRSLRLQLSDKPRSAPVLKNLLHLSRIISQPQYNHRLALENFLIHL